MNGETPGEITLMSAELQCDLNAEGWRLADVLESAGTHLRHQWADICQPGNLQSVARALLLAWAEGVSILRGTDRTAASDAGNALVLPEAFVCTLPYGRTHAVLLARLLHEHLVASAMHAFALSLGVRDIDPWRARLGAARQALGKGAADAADRDAGGTAFRRNIPLW